MIDIAHIAQTLAAAPIADEEKRAWLNLIPHMPEEDVNKLVATLTDHTTASRNLRATYLAKAETIIDSAHAKRLQEDMTDTGG